VKPALLCCVLAIIWVVHALIILNVDKQDVATVTSHVRHMAVWQFLEIGVYTLKALVSPFENQ
jgi:hypothetical protein